MSARSDAAKRLLGSALALGGVLALTSELHWGSGALIMFAGLWLLHLGREVVRLRGASPIEPRG